MHKKEGGSRARHKINAPYKSAGHGIELSEHDPDDEWVDADGKIVFINDPKKPPPFLCPVCGNPLPNREERRRRRNEKREGTFCIDCLAYLGPLF